LRDGDSEGARTYAQTPEIEHISAIIKRLLAALEAELEVSPGKVRDPLAVLNYRCGEGGKHE